MCRPLRGVARISARIDWLPIPYFPLGHRILQAYTHSPRPQAVLNTLSISSPPITIHSLTEHLLCTHPGHSPCVEGPTDWQERRLSKQFWFPLWEPGAYAGRRDERGRRAGAWRGNPGMGSKCQGSSGSCGVPQGAERVGSAVRPTFEPHFLTQ